MPQGSDKWRAAALFLLATSGQFPPSDFLLFLTLLAPARALLSSRMPWLDLIGNATGSTSTAPLPPPPTTGASDDPYWLPDEDSMGDYAGGGDDAYVSASQKRKKEDDDREQWEMEHRSRNVYMGWDQCGMGGGGGL